MRIAIVAGEASGDMLGSRLITALLQHNPNLLFEGIAGTEMVAAGCHALYPMEKLAVMGFSVKFYRYATHYCNAGNKIHLIYLLALMRQILI